MPLFFSCVNDEDETEKPGTEIAPTGFSGKELAEIHCSSCHAFVAPSFLSKTIWTEDVLPAMGHRLGIYKGTKQPDNIFGPPENRAIIEKAHVFPEKAVLAKEDWDKIVSYYTENAPHADETPSRNNPIKIGLKHFKYKEANFANRPAITVLVKILPESRGLVFGDGKKRRNVLTFLDTKLAHQRTIPLEHTPVHYREELGAAYLATIGRNFYPNDLSHGAVQKIDFNKNDHSTPLISNLQRPVSMEYGDLNDDGLEDIVACEFGDLTGKLVWYENKGNDTYEARILNNKPGAIKAIIKDSNGDGLNDIFALMGQGDEGIFYYENQGNGKFKEKRLLSFLPLNGSQYMELADFNNDGYDDIMYVCGDNADKTPILKAYHGVYIFLNDGKFNFLQSYFYHQNGAYKAIPRDYDQDGDLDIASISYFPDYLDNPQESFVYLENKGNLRFNALSFPEASKGRWMVMDAEDIDGDGDIDIALGSNVQFLAQGDTTGLSKKWLTESPSVIVLENTLK
ncbi:VCBS repeat-containing protein [Arcticibacterium luteifluviistationis]|uniref:VCBS repeat-containing protein n=2 Tax=Arcticibacterium luteifluviistationis TaxID=1784714 RepID=A0A2Z4GIL6_9BACT|nr:VCBS repeat-containing protein [Arcticibacterium luteifluviistationis]